MSDIGAIDPGSWQLWHLAWRIGATSLEKVTAGSAATATPGRTSSAPAAKVPAAKLNLHPDIIELLT